MTDKLGYVIDPEELNATSSVCFYLAIFCAVLAIVVSCITCVDSSECNSVLDIIKIIQVILLIATGFFLGGSIIIRSIKFKKDT